MKELILEQIKRLYKQGLRNSIKSGVNKKYKNIILFRNSYLNIHHLSKIEVENKFSFNTKWANFDPKKSFLIMRQRSTLIVNNFRIYSGANISINDNATLKLGSGYINHNVNISCFERIEIGKDVAISENVTIRDSDNHRIISAKGKTTSPIIIEDHVWIGMNVIILKGVTIGSGSIIAAGAVVNKDIPKNVMAAGVPAVVIKTDIFWE